MEVIMNNPKTVHLDKEEKDLLESIENDEWESVKDIKEERS